MYSVLNNFTVQTKIIGFSVFFLLLLIISSAYALFSMNQIGGELHAIAYEDIVMTQKLTKVTEHQLEQVIHFERAMRYGEQNLSEANASTQFTTEIRAFDNLSDQIDEELQAGIQFAESVVVKADSDKVAEEFRHVSGALKTIAFEHKEFVEHSHRVFKLLAEGDLVDAEQSATQAVGEEEQLIHELESLLAQIEKFTSESAQRAEAHEQAALKTLSVIVVFALVTGLLVSRLFSQNLSKRLGTTAKSLATIAAGDLTRQLKVDGLDEVGNLQKSAQDMQSSLLTMLSQITRSTDQIATAAEEVSVVTKQSSSNSLRPIRWRRQ